MMQRQITHPAGAFAPCGRCNKEPRHYSAHGSARDERASFTARSDRHQLECACERRTGWCGSLAEAVRVWEQQGETLPREAASASNVHPIRGHRREP
jgi:hypothetical protein